MQKGAYSAITDVPKHGSISITFSQQRALHFYLPLRNGNLTLAQQQGCRWATATLLLSSGKLFCLALNREWAVREGYLRSIISGDVTPSRRTFSRHGKLYLVSAIKSRNNKQLTTIGGHWQIEKEEYRFGLNQT